MDNPQILVVDDQEMLQVALRRVLERSGLRVLTAGSGAEALAVLEKTPVPMVISDLRMPGLSGIELLAQVKQRWPSTLRLVLTAEFDQALMAAISSCDVHRCIAKPWNNEVLTTLVKHLLAQFQTANAG